MLHEPEASMVAAWIDGGGKIRLVPFGVSGKVWRFADLARNTGMWASFKRYGAKHIENGALPHIAYGEISAAQARVGVVWEALRARGPMYAEQLGRAIDLEKNAARRVLHELVAIGAGAWVPDARFATVRALGATPPHWKDYLPAQSRAA
jgi:hypothetical protein